MGQISINNPSWQPRTAILPCAKTIFIITQTAYTRLDISRLAILSVNAQPHDWRAFILALARTGAYFVVIEEVADFTLC